MRRAVLFCLALSTASVASAATFTVTNLSDADPGSLRDAIAQANANPGADTIAFGVTGTITLTSGLILVTEALTIQGPGAAQLTIDGNANNRIFAIVESNAPACPSLTGPSDYLVSISGLTLRNGQRNVANSVGGAIYSAKSLAVDGVTFESNRARGGGAIWMATQYPNQSLSISNSRFANNEAREIVAGTTAGHVGGAVAVNELCTGTRTQPVSVTIADSVFTGNVAQAGVVNARGGAIQFNGDADVLIGRTTIDGNKALPNSGNPNVNAQGGGISGAAKTFTIYNSTVSGNEAQRNVALHLFNDALARQSFPERMIAEVVNATISGNRAYESGAVLAFANVELSLFNTTLVGNRSDQNRTGGITLSTGATVPASASNALAPTLALESSVLWNPVSVRDVSKDNLTMPGSLVVQSNNSLVGRLCDSACGPGLISLSGVGNILGVDPLLGALADNGGPTRTRVPQLGSAVVGTGNNALALTEDQRGAGFPRTIGAVTDMGAAEYAYTTLCDGFTDVTGNSPFCPSVSWMKNRNVTTGCGGGNYCPSPDVSRLAMAAFMKRLGDAATEAQVLKAETSGALDIDTDPFVCATADFTATGFPRHAAIDGVFSGTAAADLGMVLNIAASYDGGATWQNLRSRPDQAHIKANQWRNYRVMGTLDIPAGTTVRFGLHVDRGGLSGASQIADSACNLRARIRNSNGFTPQ